jgi:hypothetical protein
MNEANIQGGGKIVHVVLKYTVQKPAVERGGAERKIDL